MQINNSLVVLDFETTGVDTSKDRIVQVALLKVEPSGDRSKFKTLVNPQIPIPPEATEVHGISNEDVKDAPTFDQIADTILDFIKGCDIASFNGNRFDIPLLSSELETVGRSLDISGVQLIDVRNIELGIHPNTLSGVYERYTGKTLDDAHDAMADVEATLEVLQHQMSILEALDEPVTYGDLENFSRKGKPRADVAGLFTFDDNNILCWGFGKHRGNPVTTSLGYNDWFYRQDFPRESKLFLSNYLKELKS